MGGLISCVSNKLRENKNNNKKRRRCLISESNNQAFRSVWGAQNNRLYTLLHAFMLRLVCRLLGVKIVLPPEIPPKIRGSVLRVN